MSIPGDRTATLPRAWTLRTVVAGLLVAVALPASSAERFLDVPTDAVHHEAVGRLVAAGLTAGCAQDPPRFCSDDLLTRRQMALFLDRMAPRSAGGAGATTLAPTADGLGGTPATVAITPGGVAGGSGGLVVEGSVTVTTTDRAGCPCEVEAFVYRLDDHAQGPSTWDVLPGDPLAGGRVSVSLPVTWALEVAGATPARYGVAVFVAPSPGAATAEASLAAIWTPYRGTS